jgi:murein DD-endopeptidase MepM/ murein hydrolase activator NlpD
MSKGKYKYNPETLEFENSERSKTKKLLIKGLSVFIGAVIIAVSVFFIFVLFFDINIKKQKAAENKILQEEYNKLIKRKAQNDKYLKELIKKDEIIYQSVFKSLPDNSVFEEKNPYVKFSELDINKIIEANSSRLSKDKIKVRDEKLKYSEFFKKMSKPDNKSDKNIPSIQPVFNFDIKYPVYGYGKRIDQVYKSLIFHPGIDFAVPEGTAVFASADGKIEKSGRKRGMGERIVINHGNGYKTVYAHLDKIFVNIGKSVKRGQKIGTVGMTGKTLIPHLHYEIEFKGKPVNPVNYFFLDLDPQKLAQIISDSNKSGLSLD